MVAIIISVVVMLVLVVLDQVSKYFIVSAFDMGQHIGKLDLDALEAIVEGLEPIELIPGVLNFRFVLNDGAAFGSMDNASWIFMILSTVAIIAILVYMFWKKPQNKLLLVSLTLITGGGIGNMIDRVWLGYVIDFIDFCAFPKLWMWVFNVADSCVTVGAALLALWMIIDVVKDIRREKGKKLAVAEVETDAVAEVETDAVAEVETDAVAEVEVEAGMDETVENGDTDDRNDE